ncbi:type III restriction/modification enzyme restriction subunit [Solirubrobacter pauli]|uniref:Type III restriction/modification enzyme restriction subunit n=1 Tax=Solirubrobacter pauli TaxID=166793 RepID=A0A660LAI9_9ACTN|nr:DEAD/DEAH box helicase [Solirubrobacter pauli]RKQ90893.1 type III restriction/modification enzyme restriction subunit [Solirubrobacter pauli]
MSQVEGAPPAPGSVVLVRDEEWLVTRTERADDGEWFVSAQGVSELVRDTEAIFSTALEDVQHLDPAAAQVVADDSPGHRRSRLWLEAMARKTAVPITDPSLTVATQGLADFLPYQLAAVRKALAPENLRPRILLADAVGLGKTLEIGMILAELVRRGRGERILVVTPRHVLEQMQFELWTRFALPFVRLDSLGIQRIRQKLPGNRNPFAYFKRAIISIDTLKSDRYISHLRKQHWDAVVIDESHNVTGASQNNRLARLLSTRTDALILASATPHNGRKESFAELIRMLEPSAVTPEGELVEEEVKRLVIRRHRHSEEVASYVGGDWAERLSPDNRVVKASAIENEIARELDETWVHPAAGQSPYSGANSALFPWTLVKAFLSSPAALLASATDRRKRLADPDSREAEALKRLESLAQRGLMEPTAKYAALRDHLREIGVGKGKPTRVVIFAERVPTLQFLRERLCADLKLNADEIAVLHGGLTDTEQQSVVESFKLESSPIRVLVTGDVASEGVNLHLQCHHLVHYDIPWSLIRIQQRNGRIDRYGQKHSPRITTLLLDPDVQNSLGDLRVLTRLMEREHEAHKALGDSASLMGKHDVKTEEDEIRKVLAGQQRFEDTVRSVAEIGQGGDFDDLFARLLDAPTNAPTPDLATHATAYDRDLDFLSDTLDEVLETPGLPWPDGVSWKPQPTHQIVDLEPSPDLRRRLEVLPQSYIKDRQVTERLRLATTTARGSAALAAARGPGQHTLWPEAHYLSPLHPVVEWAADRALAQLGRNQVFGMRGPVEHVSVLLQGTLTNRRGQVVAASFVVVQFVGGAPDRLPLPEAHATLRSALERLGIAVAHVNTGPVAELTELTAYVAPAVKQARTFLSTVVSAIEAATSERVSSWAERVQRWDHAADSLAQRSEVRDRRALVAGEKEIAESLLPDQRLVRPLLVVVPKGEQR